MAGASNVSADGDDIGLVEIDGAIGFNIADGDLDWGEIFGSDNSVSIVTFSWKIDIADFVLVIDGTLHFGLDVSLSSGLHAHGNK